MQESENEIKLLKEQLKIANEARKYSHDNNMILNKNLVLKFEECDKLKARISELEKIIDGLD